jgi:hypothetical protein
LLHAAEDLECRRRRLRGQLSRRRRPQNGRDNHPQPFDRPHRTVVAVKMHNGGRRAARRKPHQRVGADISIKHGAGAADSADLVVAFPP